MLRRLALLSLLAFSQSAFAKTDDERARDLFRNGKMLFDEERYEEALKAFEEAYKLSERHLLLYNIASTHEKLGDFEKAQKLLYEYRIYAPPEDQESLRLKIEGLEKSIEEQKALNAQKEAEKAAAEKAAIEKAAIEKAAMEQATAAAAAEQAAAAAAEQAAAKTVLSPMVSTAVWSASGAFLATAMTTTILARRTMKTGLQSGCIEEDGKLYCIGAAGEEALGKYSTQALLADLTWGLTAVALGTGIGLQFIPSNEDGAAMAGLAFEGSF
jgi:tetratricopeptide (TPR) repeat protein